MPLEAPQPTRHVNERNLCVLYGDHDECPYQEVDDDGNLSLCNCSCHLDPEDLSHS